MVRARFCFLLKTTLLEESVLGEDGDEDLFLKETRGVKVWSENSSEEDNEDEDEEDREGDEGPEIELREESEPDEDDSSPSERFMMRMQGDDLDFFRLRISVAEEESTIRRGIRIPQGVNLVSDERNL